MYGVRKCSSFINLHAAVHQVSDYHLLKRLPFLHCIFLPPLSKINWPQVCGFISGLFLLFHWSICLFLYQHYIVLITVSLQYIWSLEGFEVPRWLNGKRICLTIQEMQKSLVKSMGQEDTHGEGNSNPLQYSCLENPMDRRGWWGQKELDMTEHAQSSHTSGRVMPPSLLFFLRIAW